MNFSFTDRTKRVLASSREEAIALQHDYIGTVHILLGLLREAEGVAAATLLCMNVDVEAVRRRIRESIGKGNAPVTFGELPYTSRAKNALEAAMAEARSLNHTYVGTEHLLLGLLREEEGIAAKVLNAVGVTPDAARVEVIRLLGYPERTS